jgi:hypothetical protein
LFARGSCVPGLIYADACFRTALVLWCSVVLGHNGPEETPGVCLILGRTPASLIPALVVVRRCRYRSVTEPFLLALGLQILFDDRLEPDQNVSVCHLDLRRRDLLLELLKECARLDGGHCPGSPVRHVLASIRRIWPDVGAEKPSFKSEQAPSADIALPRRGSACREWGGLSRRHRRRPTLLTVTEPSLLALDLQILFDDRTSGTCMAAPRDPLPSLTH